MKDITGLRFGRWLVLAKDKGSAKGTTWRCRCECGTERVVRGDNLRAGRSMSCGCIAAEIGRSFRIGPPTNEVQG